MIGYNPTESRQTTLETVKSDVAFFLNGVYKHPKFLPLVQSNIKKFGDDIDKVFNESMMGWDGNWRLVRFCIEINNVESMVSIIKFINEFEDNEDGFISTLNDSNLSVSSLSKKFLYAYLRTSTFNENGFRAIYNEAIKNMKKTNGPQ